MAYKDIRKLKKINERKIEKKFVRHLVVGADFLALRLYKRLLEKYDHQEVGFFSFVSPQFENYHFKGPSLLRGEENVRILKEELPKSIFLQDELGHSLFYKEMKLRKFGGRSKPEKLLWSEDFFTGPRVKLNEDEFLKYLELNDVQEDFFTDFIHLAPTSIDRYQSDDLIEDAKWKIDCSDGTEVLCTHLYWGEAPAKFLELVENKNIFTDNQVEFFESTKTPCSLYVKFQFDQKVTEIEETVFIPLSYTHEWGHFIGEFNKESEFKEIEFFSYIDKDEASEDDVAKKIRLLKKAFEKVFGEKLMGNLKEYITLWDESLCLKIEDDLYPFGEKNLENLLFFGVQAPLSLDGENEKFHQVSGLARGLLVERSLEREIGLN